MDQLKFGAAQKWVCSNLAALRTSQKFLAQKQGVILWWCPFGSTPLNGTGAPLVMPIWQCLFGQCPFGLVPFWQCPLSLGPFSMGSFGSAPMDSAHLALPPPGPWQKYFK